MPPATQPLIMTDRRDTDRELATLLSELEETLTQLRGSLDEGDAPVAQTGRERRRAAGRREQPPVPRPPGMRELLRFTEQQTIPTLVAILEANIRLLRLAGAAIRAIDPDRSVAEPSEESVATRALDAGGRLSTDRLASGLGELQDALSGTEPTDPEARQLLEDAEQLSAEIREQLRGSGSRRDASDGQSESGATARSAGERDDAVRIEVEDATADQEPADEDSPQSGVDVDAELDSIRDEVRGDDAEEPDQSNPENSDESENDDTTVDEGSDDRAADDG